MPSPPAAPLRPTFDTPSDEPAPVLRPPGGLAPPEPDLACAGLLAGGKVVARAEPPISGHGACGIATPVTLEAVVLKDGRHVPLVPPPLLRCDMAESLAEWIRDDLAPALGQEGDLLGVADAAGYVCRGRNWIPGARLSEHARGNALDIVGLRFTKRSIGLKQPDAHAVWSLVKLTACARFTTVLGPGSDGFHETNLHLDLEHRRKGYRLCEWDDP